MDEEYDVIILGTGLKECILSGLLSVGGKKVLHMDRNEYYGAESASFNLVQTKQNLDGMTQDDAKAFCDAESGRLGRSKDYNIDLCPKLLMSSGKLVKTLLHTKVTRYLEFKAVDGSYVFQANDDGVHPVPVTASEALNSSLMGMMQKRRYKTFLEFVIDVNVNDQSTWKASGMGWSKEFDLNQETPRGLMEYFKLEAQTMDFSGHAIALYNDDQFLDQPGCLDFVAKMQLYANSLARYAGRSPYLYPMWGLGGLPEGFSRLAAVHGGVYMLRRPISDILYNDDGTVKGVVSNGESAFCKQLIGDPSYFKGSEKIQPTGFVARYILILSGPVPGVPPAVESCQVIFPATQTGHHADIYVTVVSKGLECAPLNRFVAIMSTSVPSNDESQAKSLMATAYNKLAPLIEEEWFTIRETFGPCNQQAGDNIFIPCSPDSTTHFQGATNEVLNIYHAMTGQPLDLDAVEEDVQGSTM